MKFRIVHKSQLSTIVHKCKLPFVICGHLWQLPFVAFALAVAGCSSMHPSDKTQSISLYALGIPGVAVVTSTQQTADNKGDDANSASQANPVTVEVPTK